MSLQKICYKILLLKLSLRVNVCIQIYIYTTILQQINRYNTYNMISIQNNKTI